MKIETTQTAYVTSDYDMRRFMDDLSKGETQEAANRAVLAQHDMTDSGWTKVGTARVTIELPSIDDMQSAQLAALKAQLQKERAESQVRQNAILEAISKLTCLEWEGVQA